MITHYDILGISSSATLEQIDKAREIKRQLLDPARHPDEPEVAAAAQAEQDRVDQAWETLRDPARRARYDAAVAEESSGPAESAPLLAATRRAQQAAAGAPVAYPANTRPILGPPGIEGFKGDNPDVPPRVKPPSTSIVCPVCKTSNIGHEGTQRLVCTDCATPMRFANCPNCGRFVPCDERWSMVRCLSCEHEFIPPWLSPARTANNWGSLPAFLLVFAIGALVAFTYVEHARSNATSFAIVFAVCVGVISSVLLLARLTRRSSTRKH